MTLLDANVLLYAYDSDSSQHAACRRWLDTVLNADEMLALPWQTLLAFIRICTNPWAVHNPLRASNACAIVNSWLERPNVLALEHGATLCSTDRDFRRFRGLKLLDPSEAPRAV